MEPLTYMKTAIIHDWLYSVTGAEKVLEAIYQIFPSKVHTLIKNPKKLKNFCIPDQEIVTSFIQRLPFAKTNYPYYLPLFPFAIENFNVSDADLIISSSSSVAKGILTHSNQLHICYCHTPMRYIWDLYFEYLELNRLNKGIKGFLTKLFFHKIRNWDLLHSVRVDHFIANSKNVAKRIEKIYQKKADVIYPPVDCAYFKSEKTSNQEFYVTAARLVPYKRIDLIVKAFAQLKNKKLVVIGEGPELNALKSLATKNIEFTGYVTREELKRYFHLGKAFIYMAYEDFGIFPVEAQAAGLPIIAYGKGGILETVLENKTGIFFSEQTPESLIQAVNIFEQSENSFDKVVIEAHSQKFSQDVFAKNFSKFVQDKYEIFSEGKK